VAGASYGAGTGTGAVEIIHGEPALRNNSELVRLVNPAPRAQRFDAAKPMRSCGSADFSSLSDEHLGLMMFLGTPTHRPDLTLHSADFLPDDESAGAVAKVLAMAWRNAHDRFRAGQGLERGLPRGLIDGDKDGVLAAGHVVRRYVIGFNVNTLWLLFTMPSSLGIFGTRQKA